MSRPHSRRAVLSLGAAALLSLAGCISGNDPDGSTSGDGPGTSPTASETPDAPPTETTTDFHDYRRIDVTVHPADPADVADAVVRRFSALSERQRAIVSETVGEEEAISTTYTEKPLDDGTYVARDGAYYRVQVETAAERERTAHRFHLEAVSDCGHLYDEAEREAARESAVAFAALPDADKEAFLFTHEERFREGACFSSGYHYVYESADGVEQSVLVADDPTHVEYDGATYRVEFRGTRSIVEHDYRYTANRIADSEAQLHEVLVRDVVIHLRASDLPTEERDLLDSLTGEDRYQQWKNPIPDRVDASVTRIRRHDAHGEWGRYFVRYRGDLYRFRIEEAVA